MGNCYKSQSTSSSGERIFFKKVSIEIKCKNYSEKVSFTLTRPERIFQKIYTLENAEFQVSSCIIPGIDPRAQIKKSCQDSLFISDQRGSLLLGIFDGHGKHGREVVEFCAGFMTEFFQTSFGENIKEELTRMVEECDKALLGSSNIDCSTSGTTAAIVLLNKQGMWACSVGDSRAILGTLPKYNRIVEYKASRVASDYIRPIVPLRALKAVQLTLDQKPNISYELERIIKAGGLVSQLSNSEGVKIGPYRVWKQSAKIPGLAMSRSLGDKIAKSIGVISNPIIYKLEISHSRDQFVVLATDGIWDVMDNSEVVNFIEKYKKLCSRSIDLTKDNVDCNNSVIAEFLCEEARYRWLGVCSDEDVAIDDISAIVVELTFKDFSDSPAMKRKGITLERTLDLQENNRVIQMDQRFDIHRGSNAVIEEEEEDEGEDD